jgi:hypothetical protein
MQHPATEIVFHIEEADRFHFFALTNALREAKIAFRYSPDATTEIEEGGFDVEAVVGAMNEGHKGEAIIVGSEERLEPDEVMELQQEILALVGDYMQNNFGMSIVEDDE